MLACTETRHPQTCVGGQVIGQLQILRESIPGTAHEAYQGIPKVWLQHSAICADFSSQDDFMRFAMYKLPGIEDALTVIAALQM